MRYYLTFDFTETEEQAQKIINNYNATATPYARKHHKGHYTTYQSNSPTDKAHFVAFTYYRR